MPNREEMINRKKERKSPLQVSEPAGGEDGGKSPSNSWLVKNLTEILVYVGERKEYADVSGGSRQVGSDVKALDSRVPISAIAPLDESRRIKPKIPPTFTGNRFSTATSYAPSRHSGTRQQ